MSNWEGNHITVKFTFIRHGESTDNLRSVWAGTKDSGLSTHGKVQAEALGKWFKSTSFTAIHTSPLQRAVATAEALYKYQASCVPLNTSLLLQEQHFGIGEGQRYGVRRESRLSLKEHLAKGKYISIHDRNGRFPDGESLQDVARRADQAVKDLILPHIRKAAKEGINDVHVAFVSHVRAEPMNYRGLKNTGWSQLTVQITRGWEGDSQDVCFSSCGPHIRVVRHNSYEHLDGLVRQKGGRGSAEYDPNQKDIRSYFRPKSTSKASKTV